LTEQHWGREESERAKKKCAFPTRIPGEEHKGAIRGREDEDEETRRRTRRRDKLIVSALNISIARHARFFLSIVDPGPTAGRDQLPMPSARNQFVDAIDKQSVQHVKLDNVDFTVNGINCVRPGTTFHVITA